MMQETYTFHPSLNVEHLNEFYEGDVEHAHDMFEIFMDDSVEEFKQIHSLVEQQDWVEIGKLAHKLKPAFSMVGLSELYEKMVELESLSKTPGNETAMSQIVDFSQQQLSTFIPILKAELDKMKQFID